MNQKPSSFLTVLLKQSFVIRVPLIPGVTAIDENLEAIAHVAKGLAGLIRVDLLTYNRAAGGKYSALRKQFYPTCDDETLPVQVSLAAFEAAGVRAGVVGAITQ
jgi:pyruvate-formate lyase-activating enzyme